MNNNYLPPELEEFFDQMSRLYPEDQRKVHEITFQITEDCCMACTYCYQNKKSNNKMTWEVAKIIIDKLLNDEFEVVNTSNTKAIVIQFIGGEPLMEISLINQICNYTMSKMIELNHPWLYYLRFSLCSNGLLYNTKDVQYFLKQYNNLCSLSISIDGNETLHDSCRVDLAGRGTYNRILNNIHLHQKNYNKIPLTKMTLSPSNIAYTYEALINLVNEGYTQIPFNCVFEKGWNNSHAKILYYELKKAADYLLNQNLYNKINMRMFREKSFCPMSEYENNNWCGGTDMRMIAFDYKGDIFPCIRYMGSSLNNKQEPIKVGNINTGYLITDEEKNNFQLISNITRRSQSTDECFYCPVAEGCSWCSGYNYEEFGTPNKRATYICCMHKAQSLANVYYWNKLYQKLNIDKIFKMYLPKEEALKIIDEEEYALLQKLSEGGTKNG